MQTDSPLNADEEIYCLALSPDSQWLAHGTSQGQVGIYSIATRRKTLLSRLTGAVWSLTVSPDNEHVLAGGTDGQVYVYHLKAKEEVYRCRPHKSAISQLTILPLQNARWVFSSGYDRTLRAWDLLAQREHYCSASYEHPLRCLAVAPDGRRIGTGAIDGSLAVWDWQENQFSLVWHVRAHKGGIAKLAMTSDGLLLLSTAYDGTAASGTLLNGAKFTLGLAQSRGLPVPLLPRSEDSLRLEARMVVSVSPTLICYPKLVGGLTGLARSPLVNQRRGCFASRIR